MISLFYFLAACAIEASRYTSFAGLAGFVVFLSLSCFAADFHFKPGLGVTVLSLVLFCLMPWLYAVLLWLGVSAIEAGLKGRMQ